MPKNTVSDLITDQEMSFARLVLSGAMTDRDAAQAAGLNPDTAAYTKAKPRVRAFMLEHRAAVQQQLAEQEAEGQRQLNLGREQVLARLWEIANLSPEMTRGSITGQVKALSMIIAMQGLIPDRRAASAKKESAPAPTDATFYVSAWRREQEENTPGPEPDPAPAKEGDLPRVAEPEPVPASAANATPPPAPNPFSPLQRTPDAYSSMFASAPETRTGTLSHNNPFTRRR